MANKIVSIKGQGVSKQLVDVLGDESIYAEQVAVTLVNAGGAVDTWTPDTVIDVTADDSDKAFAVPANREWMVMAVQVTLVTTGEAGNRQMAVEFRNGSADVLVPVIASVVQAASLTRYYTFGVGLPNDAAFRGPDTDRLATGIPPLTLAASWDIRVYDMAAIDADADDMSVWVTIIHRAV
jgi:hypothetical protein